jgi:hypothetical protein
MSLPTLTIRDLVPDRKALSRDAFIAKYSHPFLVERERAAAAPEGESTFATMQVSKQQIRNIMAGGGEMGSHLGVVRVVKRASNAFAGMINVGRAANNDLVIDSPAISKFHAYFSRDAASGSHCITDADSTNGTFVNGKRLEAHKQQRLRDGDVISFSQAFDFTHYTAGGLYDMMRFHAT